MRSAKVAVADIISIQNENARIITDSLIDSMKEVIIKRDFAHIELISNKGDEYTCKVDVRLKINIKNSPRHFAAINDLRMLKDYYNYNYSKFIFSSDQIEKLKEDNIKILDANIEVKSFAGDNLVNKVSIEDYLKYKPLVFFHGLITCGLWPLWEYYQLKKFKNMDHNIYLDTKMTIILTNGLD